MPFKNVLGEKKNVLEILDRDLKTKNVFEIHFFISFIKYCIPPEF